MIVVQGAFKFQFSLGDIVDLIQDHRDLTKFKMTELAGGSLPMFELSFQTTNSDVSGLLTEGSRIKVTYGFFDGSYDDMTSSELFITKKRVMKKDSNSFLINCVGFLANPQFINERKFRFFKGQSSVEVLKSIAEDYFEWDSNIESLKDQMTWIQSGLTDKRFATDLVLHSDLGDSFPVFGITGNNVFRYLDVVKRMQEVVGKKDNWDWRFTYLTSLPHKDLPLESQILYTEQSGYLNSRYGYGRSKRVTGLELGTYSDTITELQDPVFAQSTLNRTLGTIPKRISPGSQSLDNVHPNYWSCYEHNLVHNMCLSTLTAKLKLSRIFKHIKILDFVYLQEEERSTGEKVSAESLSGLYLVSKVTRVLQGVNLTTGVVLDRETFNANRGDLK